MPAAFNSDRRDTVRPDSGSVIFVLVLIGMRAIDSYLLPVLQPLRFVQRVGGYHVYLRELSAVEVIF